MLCGLQIDFKLLARIHISGPATAPSIYNQKCPKLFLRHSYWHIEYKLELPSIDSQWKAHCDWLIAKYAKDAGRGKSPEVVQLESIYLRDCARKYWVMLVIWSVNNKYILLWNFGRKIYYSNQLVWFKRLEMVIIVKRSLTLNSPPFPFPHSVDPGT